MSAEVPFSMTAGEKVALKATGRAAIVVDRPKVFLQHEGHEDHQGHEGQTGHDVEAESMSFRTLRVSSS